MEIRLNTIWSMSRVYQMADLLQRMEKNIPQIVITAIILISIFVTVIQIL